jgi:hypothetical protein
VFDRCLTTDPAIAIKKFPASLRIGREFFVASNGKCPATTRTLTGHSESRPQQEDEFNARAIAEQ